MNIGDKVRVIDAGEAYEHYDSMFKLLAFKDTKYNSMSGFKGEECTVFNKHKHPKFDKLLIAIRHSNGRELLIQERGIVLVSKAEHRLFKLL